MARIMFAWELGGGLGHVAPYVETIRQLTAKGHEVTFALRDVSRAETVLAPSGAAYIQAPVMLKPVPHAISTLHSYPQILHNVGYHDPNVLIALIKAWRRQIELIQPEVLIVDHSPTALLASRLTGIRRIIVGTGFTIPPAITPMPNMRYWSEVDSEFLTRFEDRILGNINTAMRRLGSTPLESVAEIFNADAVVFRSLPELDHYPVRSVRPAAEYWGPWPAMKATAPVWPRAPRRGKKMFAYLKPSRALPAALEALRQMGQASIVYLESGSEPLIKQFSAPHISFVDCPQDMSKMATECNMAILNSNHDTMIDLLLAGKPVFMLPLTLEQYMLTKKVEQLGMGVSTTATSQKELGALLESMGNTESYRIAAREFAQKHASLNRNTLQARFRELIEGNP